MRDFTDCTITALACALALSVVACGGACPHAESPANRTAWAEQLAAKRHLVTDGAKPITIKRDVHSFDLDADADRVARAFHDVMRNPENRYGLIQVDRPDAEVGKPFRLGSRFQGRYRVGEANPTLSRLSQWPPARAAFCAFENQSTSDYGYIAVLQLPPETPPTDAPAHPAVGTSYVLEYTYLEGSPIGGSSRFEVTQLADNSSRLTQIFTYQEVNASFAAFFANGGLTLHEQVVSSQVAKTAKALGVAMRSVDMPKEYLIP